MKKTLIILVILFSSCRAMTQEVPDSLKIEKDGWSYYQNGYRISAKEMEQITYDNDDAWSHVRNARTCHNLSTVFSCAGGFLVGYAFGNSLYNNDVNWIIVYSAGAVACAAIPFAVGYYMHLNIAMKVYNKGPKPTAYKKVEFNLGQTNNGFGLAMRF